MPGPRFRTLAAAIFALAAGGPLYGQSSARPLTGDDVLRTHGHGLHATAAAETGMAPQPDTVTVSGTSLEDSLDAANRARADSVEQARLATLDAANRARTDSVEQARVAAADTTNRGRTDSLGQASAALQEELAGLIHFEFDRSGIEPADRAALDRKAAILTANPAVRVRIAGYCDDRGSVEYNLALGNRRAAAAKQYLVERGVDAARLDAVSFGSASPVDSSQNETAWALNRRAGFEVASGGNVLTAPVALR